MTDTCENVVFFIVDEKYLPMAYINAARIVQLAENDIAIEVFVESVTPPDFPPVDGVRVRLNRLSPHLPDNLPFSEHLPPVVWARLVAPVVLQRFGYKRALHLDADIGIAGDISSVFSLDTVDARLAAVPDTGMQVPYSTFDSKLTNRQYLEDIGIRNRRYFNAGVMLFDVDEWVEGELLSRLPDYLRTYGAASRLFDQDFLNFLLQDTWQTLSPRWNFQGMLLDLELEPVLHPLIVHYTGIVKPWFKKHFKGDPVHAAYFSKLLDRMNFCPPAIVAPAKGRYKITHEVRKYYRLWLLEKGILTPKMTRKVKKWRQDRKYMYDFVLKYLVNGEFCDISSEKAVPMIIQLNRLIEKNGSASFLPNIREYDYFANDKEHWPGLEIE